MPVERELRAGRDRPARPAVGIPPAHETHRMSSESWAIAVLCLYAAVAVGLVLRDKRRSRAAWPLWALYVTERVYVPLMFRWRANRRSPLPEEGPALILANHRSPVDPLMIWMNHHLDYRTGLVRPISFLMAREYYHVRGIQWICEANQSIPVDRDGQDMGGAREALARLKRGDLVGVFPEGRIHEGPGMGPWSPGIAWLALRSQVPVLPVWIAGTLPPVTMVYPFRTPTRVRVTFGDPIDLSAYRGRRITQPLLREVTDLLMRRVGELGGLPPESLPLSGREPVAGFVGPSDRATG
jgi:1-acyl-sn-glycerol-3-phosphate acyltransferase